jgi:hypothetical protein
LIRIETNDQLDHYRYYWGRLKEGKLYQLATDGYGPLYFSFFTKKDGWYGGEFKVSWSKKRQDLIYKLYLGPPSKNRDTIKFRRIDDPVSLTQMSEKIRNGDLKLESVPQLRIPLGFYQFPNSDVQVYVDQNVFHLPLDEEYHLYYRVFFGSPLNRRQLTVLRVNRNQLTLENGYTLEIPVEQCPCVGKYLIRIPQYSFQFCQKCSREKHSFQPARYYHSSSPLVLDEEVLTPVVSDLRQFDPQTLGISFLNWDRIDLHAPSEVPSLKSLALQKILKNPRLRRRLATMFPNEVIQEDLGVNE